MRKIAFILFTFLAVSSANAQQQFSGWLASFNTFKINKNLGLHFDAQIRTTDELQHVQTILLRPGLNVRFSNKITGSVGYGFIQNRRVISNVTGTAIENRIWQQLLINEKFNNISSAHRFRLEQRFLPVSKLVNGEIITDGNKYSNRIRYFTRNVLPLNKQSQFSKGMFAGLQNEVMLNFGNTSSVNGKTFDQNRLFLSLGYRINTKIDIEAGYMNQYISGRNTSFTNNHILQFCAYTRF